MPPQEYVVRLQDGLWLVWLDDRLLGGQSSQMGALKVADALARAGALRGRRSRILVGEIDGGSIEFPVIEPARRRA
jgi:hypothetical protein